MTPLSQLCRKGAAALLSLLIAVVITSCSSFAARAEVVEIDNCPIFHDLHLPVYAWTQTNSSPQAIIVALHGGCLHGRSFRALGQAMAEKNFMLVSMDMRGYGVWFHEGFGTKSDRRFNYAKSREDITLIINKLHECYPGTPVFVMGESLGANTAVTMAATLPKQIDGLIMVSPYAAPRLFVHRYMPVSFLAGLTNPLRQLNLKPYLKSRLSDDRQAAIEQVNDPLSRDTQSAPELVQSLFSNNRGKKDALRLPSGMPVLVMIGKKDGLCNPKATQKLYMKMPSNDKTMVVLVNRGHLLVETSNIQPEIIEILGGWLDAHSTVTIME